MDLMLDIVVEGAGQWRWKDQDEFDAVVTAGLIDEVEAARVRDEGQRVITDIEANVRPFSEPWHTWRPEPDWPVPTLPSDWERV